uniref:EF-hand domain-containing protein n=1 Tax=Plectus sambesii TaxID=2011161 RepID=A0A914XDG3_9BILA
MASRYSVIFLVCAVAYLTKVISADAESDKVIADTFKKADHNKDGKWNFEEYLQRDENLIQFERDRFNEMDTNKDKFVTLEENKIFFEKQAEKQEQQDKTEAANKGAKAAPKSPRPKASPTAKAKPKHN